MSNDSPDDFDRNPYAFSDEESGTQSEHSDSEMEEIRNENLSHEGMVQGVGVFFLISGTLALMLAAIFGAALVKGELPRALPERPDPDSRIVVTEEVAWVLLIVYGISAPIALTLGQSLRRLSNGARITAAILTIPGLLGIPVGTLVAAIILYILLSPKGAYVCTSEYREVIEATPEIRYRTSPIIKVLVGIFLFFMVIALIAIAANILYPPAQR